MGDGTEVRAADPNSGNALMLALLGAGLGARMQKVISFSWTAQTFAKVARSQYQRGRARVAYSITVDGTDPMYQDIHAWLLTAITPARQRALIATTGDGQVLAYASPVDEPTPTRPPIRFLFDGEREQMVVIGGHRVKVAVAKDTSYDKRKEYRITFTAWGVSARDAVIAMLTEVATSRTATERVPRLYLATRWGDWQRRDDLAARSPDSVILRAGVMEALIDDLALFRSHEDDYVRLGVPFHRGYLLHGPPGTGKSSVVRALATHFGTDLYYLPLGDLESDANLTQLVARVPAGAVLLIEDIDTYLIARNRAEAGDHTTGAGFDPGASLSGLLNALDGVATPHGLVTALTTNDRSVLDEALVRAFRVNVDQHIDFLDDEQLHRLLGKFLDVSHPECTIAPGRDVTPAAVLNAIMANLDDTDAALAAVKGLIG